MSYDYTRLREAWTEVSDAFGKVAGTCIETATPWQTAVALRDASQVLMKAAEEYKSLDEAIRNAHHS